ncbi:MAG: ABC transporter ATP-binding protein, partial [Candidatus Lokiarchaeota archaeon]|nr:ABC transporter ATP-binding protein [Candidatus Lokiarchaeota archaeon]
LGVIVGITFVTLTRTIIPLILGDIIDFIPTISSVSDILPLILLALTIYAVNIALDYGSMMAGHFLGLRVEKNMRMEFFDIIQSKSLNYHDSARTGDLQALATYDLRIVNTMISHGAFYIYPFIQVGIALIILFDMLDLRLALFFLPFLVFYCYFILYYRKKLAPFVRARMEKNSNITIVLQDNITGTKVIKTFTTEKLERKRFLSTVQAFRENWIGENNVQSKYFPLLILYLAISILFLISCTFVFFNSFTIGELVAVNLLLITLIDPTNLIFWATNDMMSGFAACSRVFQALTKGESEDVDSSVMQIPKSFKGKIEFKNITFSYNNEKSNGTKVFENLNFIIEPQQTVALVGPTGCGKTTLAKIILSLYTPQNGTIYLDDVDIKNYPLETLRKKIGYIEQDIYLFPRSIKENIAFGKPDASDEEIREAARLAQVDEFVKDFPNGYDTIVGERGTRLSGGERQRIAIARALLTNPDIIILDDSVSAVDSETEEKIGKAIENVLKKRTTIIITHRLNTIRSSDKILVLKEGRVIAEGNHQKLLEKSEDYRRVFGKHISLSDIKIKNE